MCCGVVPILFGWFLSVPSLHALVFLWKTFLDLYYNRHHWEPTFCPLYQGIPNSGASGILVGVVLCNPAVEYNIAAFSELSFAVYWQGRLSRG